MVADTLTVLNKQIDRLTAIARETEPNPWNVRNLLHELTECELERPVVVEVNGACFKLKSLDKNWRSLAGELVLVADIPEEQNEDRINALADKKILRLIEMIRQGGLP